MVGLHHILADTVLGCWRESLAVSPGLPELIPLHPTPSTEDMQQAKLDTPTWRTECSPCVGAGHNEAACRWGRWTCEASLALPWLLLTPQWLFSWRSTRFLALKSLHPLLLFVNDTVVCFVLITLWVLMGPVNLKWQHVCSPASKEGVN